MKFVTFTFLVADDTSIADRLYQDVRVACLVFTAWNNTRESAIPVNSTWGRRCNKLFFVSTKTEEDTPTTAAANNQNIERHGTRIGETLDKIFTVYLDDYAWFVTAGVNTYIILENLRYFLSTKDHRKPVYFSDRLEKHDNTSCGWAYVFSREAIRLFGQRSHGLCKFESARVDKDFDSCIKLVGITPSESMDRQERKRFHCLHPKESLMGTCALPRLFDVHDIRSGKQMASTLYSKLAIVISEKAKR